jgi:predicted DNA-binding helix-hairpin-helix protein
MSWIHGLERQGLIRSGHTTQFVVGASGESDLEIIRASAWLYEKMRLRRTYFSAFEPVKETPLESHAPTPKTRAHRLYQCDFLSRDYGWNTGMLEQALDDDGFLDLRVDPKTLFARKNKDLFPVNINKADYRTLLLVPGIGPMGARRIMAERKENGKGLDDLKHLSRLGIITDRARPFIELNGKKQASILDFGAETAA